MKAPKQRRATPSVTESSEKSSVRMVSVAELPSRFGNFRAVAFTADARHDEHLAIVRGNVRGLADVPVRIHSECLTGDVIGSLRCDCREQLQTALEHIGQLSAGVVLYMRQEGRGIGLTNKIRAYALQDHGHDTVEANHLLGFGDDERDYHTAADMLRELGVKSVKLMTNNPSKVAGLREQGIKVTGRIPVVTQANRFNASYLMTKQKRSGHWLGMGESASDARAERPTEHVAEIVPLLQPQGEPRRSAVATSNG
jgi:GTP cyclohydrolase II